MAGITWRILIQTPPTDAATTPSVQVIGVMTDIIDGKPSGNIGSPTPEGVSLDELISIYKWNIANTFKGSIGATQTVALQTSDGTTWTTVDIAQGSWTPPDTNDPLSAEAASGKYVNTGTPAVVPVTPESAVKGIWKAYEPLWIIMIAGFGSAIAAILILKWYHAGAPLPKKGAA